MSTFAVTMASALAAVAQPANHDISCEFFRENGDTFSYSISIVAAEDQLGNPEYRLSQVIDDSALLAPATHLVGSSDVHGAFNLSLSELQGSQAIPRDRSIVWVQIQAKGHEVARPASATRILLRREPGVGSEIVVVETIAVGFCRERSAAS